MGISVKKLKAGVLPVDTEKGKPGGLPFFGVFPV